MGRVVDYHPHRLAGGKNEADQIGIIKNPALCEETQIIMQNATSGSLVIPDLRMT